MTDFELPLINSMREFEASKSIGSLTDPVIALEVLLFSSNRFYSRLSQPSLLSKIKSAISYHFLFATAMFLSHPQQSRKNTRFAYQARSPRWEGERLCFTNIPVVVSV
mgnify:CR=1 FL=1